MDGALLGMFMVSASVFGVLLFHPGSRVVRGVRSEALRRGLMGLAMGSTAALLIYSPWGTTSGAHMNPAVTIAFLALGKITGVDAALYCGAQVLGGLVGIVAAWAVMGVRLTHPAVQCVATLPGRFGAKWAAVAEFGIAFTQLLVVLVTANIMATQRMTGLIAGAMVAGWVFFLAPVSGMSMNPARTLASAVVARRWDALWVYALVPPLGMLSAAGVYVLLDGHVFCAKLCHPSAAAGCPFRCEFGTLSGVYGQPTRQ